MRQRLTEILARNASPEAMDWLRETAEAQLSEFRLHPFYYAFSGVSRRFGKHDAVDAPPEQLAALSAEAPGFTVAGWDHFRLARVILLLVLAEQGKEAFLDALRALLDTADLRESAAIYSALPLLPHPGELVEPAVDGLRTNIVDVFDAIALDNPFPAEHFADEAWNQMVLKALFIDRPLHRIRGLDERANAALAEALSNLAHERWAAGRTVSPEQWRCCQGFLDDTLVADLERVAASEDPADREAAALALHHEGGARLGHLRERLDAEGARIASGELSWESLGRRLHP